MDEKVHILSNYLLSPRVLSELRISILPYLTALVELRAWKSFLKVFFSAEKILWFDWRHAEVSPLQKSKLLHILA